MQHRIGNGYVYCSRFISDDEAAATLSANLDGAALAEPRVLRFTTGRRTTDLESQLRGASASRRDSSSRSSRPASISSRRASRYLMNLFPDRSFSPVLSDEFNRLALGEYEHIRDFVVLHYHANSRDDAELWRYCRNMSIPESLARRLEFFRNSGRVLRYAADVFAAPNWLAVLLGQEVWPQHADPLVARHDREQLRAELGQIRAHLAACGRRRDTAPRVPGALLPGADLMAEPGPTWKRVVG